MFLEVVNWMFNGFEGQLDLGQERYGCLQRCLLERMRLVIIAAAVFRPHVRISKRTLKEWKRGRRWRGLLYFHAETMWNGRLPASTEVFVTVLRQAEQCCETTIFDSTWTFREAYRLATRGTQSRGVWGHLNLSQWPRSVGSTQLEVQEITCRGTKNLNNSTGFFQDFSHALQDSFAQDSILDRPCGVMETGRFEAHLKRLKNMVRIHRGQYKRVQVGWKLVETP